MKPNRQQNGAIESNKATGSNWATHAYNETTESIGTNGTMSLIEPLGPMRPMGPMAPLVQWNHRYNKTLVSREILGSHQVQTAMSIM